jgi:hypothetical protein
VWSPGNADGFRPICIYGRKARLPLTTKLAPDGEYTNDKRQCVLFFADFLLPLATANTWDMLGTNLSVKLPDGGWTTDTGRLILMDRKDFNQLGLGIDDLNGTFDYNLFSSLNPDNALMQEIKMANEDW